MSRLITKETMKAHRMRWFVYADGVRMPKVATMRGQWGYDVECSCGKWDTKTGGATKYYIDGEIFDHRLSAQREGS
jgi:hypothetical protein